jgi:hypothetical protein
MNCLGNLEREELSLSYENLIQNVGGFFDPRKSL